MRDSFLWAGAAKFAEPRRRQSGRGSRIPAVKEV